MSDGQWCELQRRQVTRGECHTCNKHYRLLGVHPFIKCFGGHTFSPYAAKFRGEEVLCPICGQSQVEIPKTGGHFCCDGVACGTNCDWYLNPAHCNMARDPKDARKWFDKTADLVHPETGGMTTVNLDGYLVARKQIDNQEALRVKDEDLKKIGRDLTEQWTNLKFLHKGNADEICRDIQDMYNRLLKPVYPEVAVRITFGLPEDKLKPVIEITGDNTITSWLLHELVPHVTIA